MATPLLVTKIEMAFGANPASNPGGWTWVDVSSYARGSVRINCGRMDEAQQTQPTQCTFRLANNDARFTPRFPTSPLYPNVRRQTPVRVSLDPTGTGTSYQQRFQGYVDSITPTWPAGNSTNAEVSVVASGILRRLGQGNKPLKSPLTRWHLQHGAVALWPLDGSFGGGATNAASPMVATSTAVSFGSTSTLGGAAAAVSVPAGESVVGIIQGTGATGFLSFDLWVLMFATAPTNTQTYIATVSATGGIRSCQLVAINDTPGPAGFQFALTDSTGGLWTLDSGIGSPGSSVNPYAGGWHNVFVTLTTSGSNTNAVLYVDGSQADSRTITGFTFGTLTGAALNNTVSLGTTGTISFAELALNTTAGTTTSYPAGFGYAGETADARMTRLCLEEGVPLTVTGSNGTVVGSQGADTFLNLLRGTEAADVGILYDGAGPGLNHLTHSARYNQPVALALDCNLYQVKLPFGPTEDDQRVHNDWTISRPNGASVRYSDAANVAANGLYDASTIHNVNTDRQLSDQASWLVHRDTPDEMRLPTLTFDPLHNPELQAQWLATTLGERVTASNLPIQYPFRSTDQVVEGYVETWDSVTWNVTLNLSPYRPWEVFTIADARLGRLETDGSQLVGAETSSNTAFEIYSSGVLWDSTATPFDVDVAGEQVTVSSIHDWLNDNPFFNGTTFAWSAQGGTFAPSSVQFHEGSGSGLLTPSGVAATSEADAQAVPILPNQSYGASVWVFCAVARNVNLTINWFTSGGSYVSTATQTTVAVAANTWTQITFPNTTSPGTAGQAAPIVTMTGTPPASNLLYIDEAKLTSPVQQQFTVTRSINGVAKSQVSGTTVKLWRPGVLAL